MRFSEYYVGQITYLNGGIYKVISIETEDDEYGVRYDYINFLDLINDDELFGEDSSPKEIDISDYRLIRILFGV